MDFQVGDIVEIVDKDGEWNSDLEIGMQGIVVKSEGWNNGRGDCVAIDWSISGKTLNHCHDIGGALKDDTGFWLNKTQIRLIDDVPYSQPDPDSIAGFWEV